MSGVEISSVIEISGTNRYFEFSYFGLVTPKCLIIEKIVCTFSVCLYDFFSAYLHIPVGLLLSNFPFGLEIFLNVNMISGEIYGVEISSTLEISGTSRYSEF